MKKVWVLMKINKKMWRCLTIVMMVVFAVVPLAQGDKVYANTQVSDSITKKAYYQGVLNCYDAGYVAQNPDLNKYTSTTPLQYLNSGSNNIDVSLVTGNGKDNLNCKKLFESNDGGLLKKFNKTIPNVNNAEGVIELTKNMGYRVTTNNNKCYSLKYIQEAEVDNNITSKNGTTNSVCLNGDELSADNSNANVRFTASGNEVCLYVPGGPDIGTGLKKGCTRLDNVSAFDGNSLMSAVNTICKSMNCQYSGGTSGAGTRYKGTVKFDSSVENGSSTTASLSSSSASFAGDKLAAVKYLSNGEAKTVADIRLSDLEKRLLYQAYLTDYYNVKVDCTSGQADSAFDGKIKWLDSDKQIKECHYETANAKNKNKKTNGIGTNGFFEKDSIQGYEDLIAKIGGLKTQYSDEELATVTPPASSNGNGSQNGENGENSENSEKERTCESNGGAKSLGWIVCPILNWMSNSAVSIYDDYVEPSLKIQPTLFTGGNNAMEKAWEAFRNFANIIFAILLMAVIFSQLTGYGIDNYGIKKILPKMIVAAILINLSFLICQVCVDLSNIVGNGIQNMFNGWADGINPGSITISQDDLSESVSTGGGGGVITAVVILAGIFTVISVWNNPAILLTLLVSALGVLISIFFLFLLLAGRQAVIVVLTVASPVAFILFMLPNTKKYFDKWLKLWSAMLILYPACGLLVGGGNFVSSLLLAVNTGGGVFGAFIAMIVGVVPIFFIPSLIKGSFAAMGNVGTKLSGLGDKLSGGATKRIRSSEGYKATQARGLERRAMKRAGIDNKTGEFNTVGKLKSKVAGSKVGRTFGLDKLQASRAEKGKKIFNERGDAAAVLAGYMATSEMDKAKAVQDEDGKEMFEAGSEGAYYAGKFNAAAAKGDRAGMDAAIKAMRNSNMKDKDIAKVIRSAQNKGLLKNLGDGEAAWKRQLYKDYGGSFLATDYELSHFMRTGGAGNKGRLGAYGEYAKNAPITPDDMRKEDLLKLSGSSLAGMAAAGKVSQGMAKQVMAMHPNLSEDKLVMFGALADGMVGKSDFQDASGNIDDKKVAEFKNNAETIIGDPYQKSGKISGLLQNIGGDQIEKWTKPVADRVTIDQQEWNEVPVHVESNGQMVPVAKNDNESLERMYPDIKEEDRATELTISHIDRRDAGTSEPGSGIILGSTGEENRRAMREFDQQQRNNRNWPGNR